MKHTFTVLSRFGPEEVFRALRVASEDTRLRGEHPDFEFEWMARRILLLADTAPGTERFLEVFQARLDQFGAPPATILPGKAAPHGEGRHALPVGILLNTPDHYAELIAATLAEIGCRASLEAGGTALTVVVNAKAKLLGYDAVVRDFPLPTHLSVRDDGKV